MLLNLLQSKSSAAGGSAQFMQTVSSKMNPETLQQLSKALPCGLPESERPPEPPALPKTSKALPAAASGPGAPRTPPMPKPPSPPGPQQADGESSASATQTAVTMLLAQLLNVQQGAPGDGTGFDGADGGVPNTAPAPPEIRQPPEPSPVSPGKIARQECFKRSCEHLKAPYEFRTLHDSRADISEARSANVLVYPKSNGEARCKTRDADSVPREVIDGAEELRRGFVG